MTDAYLHDRVSDINPDKWIVRVLPRALRPYALLMRLDRPNGVWLVLAPCWWAIAMAAPSAVPDLRLLGLFALGALIMRGAGCVINDIIDRDLDAQVPRSASRPLPAGQVGVTQAWAFAALLCAGGLIILLQLDTFTTALGALALVPVLLYPFAKRYTNWPQAFLGITVGWGALLGWSAARGELGIVPMLLFLGTVAWTLGWDTIYGHQDKADDARVGIRSGALHLGDAPCLWLAGFYGLALVFIAAAGWRAGLGVYFYPALLLPAVHMAWQVITLDVDAPASCLARFISNRDFGLLMFAACVAGQINP